MHFTNARIAYVTDVMATLLENPQPDQMQSESKINVGLCQLPMDGVLQGLHMQQHVARAERMLVFIKNPGQPLSGSVLDID